MIEIIYNDSENNGSSVIVKPPKNIRQIGTPKGRHKIYVEDYVYTFLHSSVFGKEGQRRAAVLLGKSEVSKELRYTFISGAISCDEFIFQEDGILFGENCWEYIYKELPGGISAEKRGTHPEENEYSFIYSRSGCHGDSLCDRRHHHQQL